MSDLAAMSEPQQQFSRHCEAVLHHLRKTRPLDGYSIEKYVDNRGRHVYRLKRRNIPLYDDGFLDICLHKNQTIGVEVVTSDKQAARGTVLVESDGKPSTDNARINIQLSDCATISTGSAARSSSRGSTNSRTVPSASRTGRTPARAHDGQIGNEALVQYAALGVLGLIALKVLFSIINFLSILLLPFIYLYMASNCPEINSFDAKRELKRVLRGAHLPEENQPKGFFESGLNRIAASITTELATSLGYEVSMQDFLGAARLVSVKVPVAGHNYYWIGFFNRWKYIGHRDIESSKTD